MKLTAFTSSGNNYFTLQEISIISEYLEQKSTFHYFYTQYIKEIVNVKILQDRFNLISNYANVKELEVLTPCIYYCWKCKTNSEKIAKSLCGHIIACDKCIAEMYADVYLKCVYCHHKIETFLIEVYSPY